LSLLGVPHELVDVDLMKGAQKAPEFVKLGPFGQVPVLDDNGATTADIAGYSCIAAAPEGNVDLAAYPNVRAGLARVEALRGFVPFQKTAVGLAA
jgi:glutathione S-transferase